MIFIYKHDKFRKGLPLYHIEIEEGREIMCEAVEKYGDERAIKAKIVLVQNLMKNTKFTLEQALDALGIQGDERELITKQLQK